MQTLQIGIAKGKIGKFAPCTVSSVSLTSMYDKEKHMMDILNKHGADVGCIAITTPLLYYNPCIYPCIYSDGIKAIVSEWSEQRHLPYTLYEAGDVIKNNIDLAEDRKKYEVHLAPWRPTGAFTPKAELYAAACLSDILKNHEIATPVPHA